MLWLKPVNLKERTAHSEGVNTDTVPGGLIMREGRQIETIFVERSFEPNSIDSTEFIADFKNRAARSLDTGDPHKANYQTGGSGNPFSRCGTFEF